MNRIQEFRSAGLTSIERKYWWMSRAYWGHSWGSSLPKSTSRTPRGFSASSILGASEGFFLLARGLGLHGSSWGLADGSARLHSSPRTTRGRFAPSRETRGAESRALFRTMERVTREFSLSAMGAEEGKETTGPKKPEEERALRRDGGR